MNVSVERPAYLTRTRAVVGRIVGLRAIIVAVAAALLAVAVTAGPALGAILATLSPRSARPGDWVDLTTDPGIGGADVYATIASGGPDPLWLQLADPTSPGNACSIPVGQLTWTNGVGHAHVQVPDVAPGSYWCS